MRHAARPPLRPLARRLQRPLAALRPALGVLALAACARGAAHGPPAPAPAGAPAVTLDAGEAEQVVAMLERRRAGAPVPGAAWARLTASDAYRRLQARERGLGRPFDDAAFRAFVDSDTLLARLPALRRALHDWRGLDVRAQAARAARYLPPGTPIRATLYVVLKPRTNSFVYADSAGRAIFLYLDPAVPRARVEADVVAHELHHIGLATACDAPPPGERATGPAEARRWAGALGEGLAMLAAAGGPDVHPHAASAPADRARWDADLARWPADLPRVERFLRDVAEGRLVGPAAIRAAAAPLYGEAQGPWYTVGYAVATTVERAYGRDALVEVACRPGALLARYNAAARAHAAAHAGEPPLPRWSDALIAALEAP